MHTPISADAQIDWRSLLADPAGAAGFQSLLQDILMLPSIPKPTPCHAYRDALDAFVCAWFAGLADRPAAPDLWRHLQLCADCQAAAMALAGWLAAELARQAPGQPAEHSGGSPG